MPHAFFGPDEVEAWAAILYYNFVDTRSTNRISHGLWSSFFPLDIGELIYLRDNLVLTRLDLYYILIP